MPDMQTFLGPSPPVSSDTVISAFLPFFAGIMVTLSPCEMGVFMFAGESFTVITAGVAGSPFIVLGSPFKVNVRFLPVLPIIFEDLYPAIVKRSSTVRDFVLNILIFFLLSVTMEKS